jgi:hypothetical protein
MSQFNWSYLSPGGQQYIVGLYHGPQSGHVVVYCNNEVVAIDFQVEEEAKYSFFIEEDLCEIRIEKKGTDFHYFFESNLEVDTPLNRKRQQTARRDKRFLIFFLIAAVFLAAALVGFSMYALGKAREQARIELDAGLLGVETEAVISAITAEKGLQLASFYYQTHNQLRKGKVLISADRILPNGMPIEPGDIFLAYYHTLRPEVYSIDFSKPTAVQQNRYQVRVMTQHLRLNPALGPSEADSLLNIAFERFGMEAWPIFYWQDADPERNSKFNRQRFEEAMGELAK